MYYQDDDEVNETTQEEFQEVDQCGNVTTSIIKKVVRKPLAPGAASATIPPTIPQKAVTDRWYQGYGGYSQEYNPRELEGSMRRVLDERATYKVNQAPTSPPYQKAADQPTYSTIGSEFPIQKPQSYPRPIPTQPFEYFSPCVTPRPPARQAGCVKTKVDLHAVMDGVEAKERDTLTCDLRRLQAARRKLIKDVGQLDLEEPCG